MEHIAPMTFAAKNDTTYAGITTDNAEHPLYDDPEFESIKHQALAFEHFLDMAANFESYVDHVQKFPDRVASFARGRGSAPVGLDEWFEDPDDEHKNQFSRASMLLSPGMAAQAVLQWLKNPQLRNGDVLPEHLEIAAYLGQHTVRPVTGKEYMNNITQWTHI